MKGNQQQSVCQGDQREIQVQTGLAYQVVAGGLLLLIVAMLAVLWVRERSARVAAQIESASLRQRHENVEAILRDLMVGQDHYAAQGIARGELPKRNCRLDGNEGELLLLDLQSARTLGLMSGDLILVEQSGTLPETSDGSP